MDWFEARRIPRSDGVLVLLKIPDIRQRADFDCGAAAIEAVCRYYGRKGSKAEKLANPVQGMGPDTVEAVLRSLRFRLVTGTMRVSELQHFTRTYTPVICPVADFGGHWVVVRGVERGRVHYHCPIRGQVTARLEDWEANWTSETAIGVTYENWGIAVF